MLGYTKDKQCITDFVGRQNELKEIENYIKNYQPGKSYVINICGQGGIGKTRLMQKIYSESYNMYTKSDYYSEDDSPALGRYYINASGCKSLHSLLLRFRLSLDLEIYDFEKFDAMYLLYYDAFAFEQEKNMQEAKIGLENEINKNKGNDEVKLTGSRINNLTGLAKAILGILSQAMPLWGSISKIISAVRELEESEETLEKYVSILKEIDANSNVLQREEFLLSYFKEGLASAYKEQYSVIIYLIDNFEQQENADNRLSFFHLLDQIPSFWIIASREKIAYEKVDQHISLNGLNGNNCEKLIRNCEGFDALTEENQQGLILNIVNASSVHGRADKYDDLDKVEASPLFIIAMINVLKQQIKDALETQKDEVETKRFKSIKSNIALAYYFEMGKSRTDLDCFHTLSCTDVWNTYMLSVIRSSLGLYLLNARRFLSEDSMIESVTDDSIKLHDLIREQLQQSANNRIKYDIYELMYRYFINVQYRQPIVDVDILRDFFNFTCQFCEYVHVGKYVYITESALSIYETFLNAFYKTKEKVKNNKVNYDFGELYRNIVNKYIDYAMIEANNDIHAEVVQKAYDSLHDLGDFICKQGDSKSAEEIDKEYVDYAKKNEDRNPFSYIRALNDYGYDLSANHKYDLAIIQGEEALKIGMKVFRKKDEVSDHNPMVYSLLSYYCKYEEYDKNKKEVTEESITPDYRKSLDDLKKLKEGDEFYELKSIWEKMLRTRGNIPWYYLNKSDVNEDDIIYAINYGQNTYVLRKSYYGLNNPNTLTSYHNVNVYRLKYCEKLIKNDIPYSNQINIKETLEKVCDELQKVYKLRQEVLPQSDALNMEVYEIFKKDLKYQKGEEIAFLDIFSNENIESLFPEKLFEINSGKDYVLNESEKEKFKLLNSRESVWETLQYLSNVYHLLSITEDDSDKKKALRTKAIACVENVAVLRAIKGGIEQRKTLESIRYAAEYFYEAKEYEEALKRIEYAFNFLDAKCVDDIYIEYKKLRDQIRKAKSNVN